jgi:hypothetical protein
VANPLDSEVNPIPVDDAHLKVLRPAH